MAFDSTAADAVISQSREVLGEKARSFRWAAQFLTPDTHDDAAILYAFCRLVDDVADEAPSRDVALAGLAEIEAQLTTGKGEDPLMRAFIEMAARCELDLAYARELVVGARSDLDGVCFESDVELLRYCYRVAGTVGLMMCAVLGVRDPVARPFAVDLGVGMQLTNICRDVAEDAAMGRVYLPHTRLAREGISAQQILDGEVDRAALARVVSDVLRMADWYYASGDAGLCYIPRRSRFAILVASRVYRGIGVQLREQGADPMLGRTVVHWTRKTRWVARAITQFASPKILGIAQRPEHDGALHLALEGLPGAAPRHHLAR